MRRMRMKRISAVLMSLVVALIAFDGCGSDDDCTCSEPTVPEEYLFD